MNRNYVSKSTQQTWVQVSPCIRSVRIVLRLNETAGEHHERDETGRGSHVKRQRCRHRQRRENADWFF